MVSRSSGLPMYSLPSDGETQEKMPSGNSIEITFNFGFVAASFFLTIFFPYVLMLLQTVQI